MEYEKLQEYYGTLSETINALKKKGYSLDFNIHEDCLICHQTKTQLSPDDFEIVKTYRFEGMTDPGDQTILYVIHSPKFNVKGLLVNGYGLHADEYSSRLVGKLNVAPTRIRGYEPQNPNKSNNQPLPDPLLEIDLQSLISNIKQGENWAEKELHSTIIYKSDVMRMVLMGLHKNAELKPHTAKGDISLQVLHGEIVFAANDRSVNLRKDQMIALKEGVMHSVKANQESFLLLTIALMK